MDRKISIIVPIYNAEKTLRRCVFSLVDQTYHNIEIVLVNDGSSDNSLDICKDFAHKDSRIVLLNKKNGGVSPARNMGLKKASGDFVMFCDADDWVKPNYCSEMLQNYSENQLLMCEIEKTTKSAKVIEEVETQQSYIEEISKTKFLEYRDIGLGSPTNKLFEKSIIEENKICFPEDLFLGEDLAFVLSYLECISGDIRLLHKKLYVYQLDNTNSLSKKTPSCYQNELLYEILTDAIISLKAESPKTYRLRDKIIMLDFEKILFEVSCNSSKNFVQKCKEAKYIVNTKAYQKCCDIGIGSSNKFYNWLYKLKNAELLMLYLCLIQKLRRHK